DVRAPKFDAFGVAHSALSNDLDEQEINYHFNFALRQSRRRIRHVQLSRFQIGLLKSVAAAVARSEMVESRHVLSRTPAFDGDNQILAVRTGLAPIPAI